MKFLNYLHNFVKEEKGLGVEPKKGKTGPLNGWEFSMKESPEDFGTVHVAKKGDKEITFESGDAKKFYERDYAHIIPLDELHKFVNPSEIKLDDMSVRVGFGITKGNTLLLSMQGKTPGSILDPMNPVRHTTMLDMEVEKDSANPNKLSKMFLEHAQFPQSAQGQGVLKDFFKQGLPTWESKGIKSMDLIADLTVGGHAWARYGFDFASEGLRNQYTTAFKAYAKIKGVKLENPDGYKHSWEIAAQTAKGYNGKFGDKLGKEFMLEYPSGYDAQGHPNSWHGELDLTKGSPGRIQLNAYLNGGVTKTDAHSAKKSKMSADPFSVYTALQKPKAKAEPKAEPKAQKKPKKAAVKKPKAKTSKNLSNS